MPLSSADKNSSEALFVKDNARRENETQAKHSKANILGNIGASILISSNTEDVTSNHQEQITSKNTGIIKSNQTGNVTVSSKTIPNFHCFCSHPSF